MRIKAEHTNFIMPVKSTQGAGAFDVFMPEAGSASNHETTKVNLGFSAEVPEGHVALLLPRSGIGSKQGLELNNSVGVIDSDYRGIWFATLRLKRVGNYSWEAGERVLQFLIVPVAQVELERVDALADTERGEGGFGSTGR